MNFNQKLLLTKIAPLAIAIFSGIAHANNLIENGSFETGSTAGWLSSGPWRPVDSGNSYFDSPTDGSWAMHAGEYYAWPDFFRIWQYIPTEVNKKYLLSFDFAVANIGYGTNSMIFDATFENQSITPKNPWSEGGSYTSYSQEFTATQSSSLVMFAFHQRGGTYVMAIDKIQVSPIASSIPEPNAVFLALIGIGVLYPFLGKPRLSHKDRTSP